MRCLTAHPHETRGQASHCPCIPAEGGTRGLEATWTTSCPATRALHKNLWLGTTCPAGPGSPQLSGRKSPALSTGAQRTALYSAEQDTAWSCLAGVQGAAALCARPPARTPSPTLKDRFSMMVSLRQLLVLICSLAGSSSLNQKGTKPQRMVAMIRSDGSASCHEKGRGAARRREEGTASPSGALAWRAPGTEGPGGPQPKGSRESDTPERPSHHRHQCRNAEAAAVDRESSCQQF